MTQPLTFPTPPETQFSGYTIRNGRYRMPHPETGQTRSFTRISRWADIIADKYAVEKWGEQQVLVGCARMPEALSEFAADERPAQDVMRRMLAEVHRVAGSHERSDLGTYIHHLCELHDLGVELGPVKRERLDDVSRYVDCLDRNGVRVDQRFVERVVFSPEFELVGQFDRVVEWRGEYVVLDIKTGRDAGMRERLGGPAVQLALYAAASHLWERTYSFDGPLFGWQPMPVEVSQDVGLVLALEPGGVDGGLGGVELVVVDLECGRVGAGLAAGVRGWRRSGFRVDVSGFGG